MLKRLGSMTANEKVDLGLFFGKPVAAISRMELENLDANPEILAHPPRPQAVFGYICSLAAILGT